MTSSLLIWNKNSYNTRGKVILDRLNFEFYKKNPNYKGKRFFTQLPGEIKWEPIWIFIKEMLNYWLFINLVIPYGLHNGKFN